MKTESEFRSFYRETLRPLQKEMEKLRRKTHFKNFLVTIVYLLALLLLFIVAFIINHLIYGEWLTESKANVPLIIATIALISSFFYYKGKLRGNRRHFVLTYKTHIVDKIVKFIQESLTYKPDRQISQEDFVASRLFSHTPDCYFGDDYVSGMIGQTKVAFSEVHAKYKIETTNDDGNSSEQWISIFDGLLFKADFNKNFEGTHFVLPDRAEKLFGRQGFFFQGTAKRLGERVHLEDIEFEKQFVVYGSDQVEARYILSASLMKRLTDFKRQTQKKIRISFVRSFIYIAIPYKRELWEPKYRSSAVSEKSCMEFFTDLSLVIGIVEELGLNTRIWNKA